MKTEKNTAPSRAASLSVGCVRTNLIAERIKVNELALAVGKISHMQRRHALILSFFFSRLCENAAASFIWSILADFLPFSSLGTFIPHCRAQVQP